jgi:preprotein translocase subunit SecF
MKDIIKNKKIIYLVAVIVIIIGIIVTAVARTNFSLMYEEHTRIDVYLEEAYNLDEIGQIVSEVFENEKVTYQEIETFKDTLAINISNVSDEQFTTFKEKIQEKYEIEDEDIDTCVTKTTIPHYRVRDFVKPYIIPMIITTLIILAYVGIRYLNLGIFRMVLTLALRLIVSEGVLVSIIEIFRIPVGTYFIPVALVLYIIVTTLTVIGYENELADKKEKEKKTH